MKTKFAVRAAGTILAAIAGAAAWPGAAGAHRHREPSTGLRTVAFAKAPPDFAFDAGAGPTRLGDLIGRPVVINFWASWCKPCTDELAAFADLRRTYGESVSLVSISPEQPGVARAFLQSRDLDWPLIEDPARKIFDAYSVGPIPVTIVLDRAGLVGHVSVGELDWSELQSAVEAAGAPRQAQGDNGEPPATVSPSTGPSS